MFRDQTGEAPSTSCRWGLTSLRKMFVGISQFRHFQNCGYHHRLHSSYCPLCIWKQLPLIHGRSFPVADNMRISPTSVLPDRFEALTIVTSVSQCFFWFSFSQQDPNRWRMANYYFVVRVLKLSVHHPWISEPLSTLTELWSKCDIVVLVYDLSGINRGWVYCKDPFRQLRCCHFKYTVTQFKYNVTQNLTHD